MALFRKIKNRAIEYYRLENAITLIRGMLLLANQNIHNVISVYGKRVKSMLCSVLVDVSAHDRYSIANRNLRTYTRVYYLLLYLNINMTFSICHTFYTLHIHV